MILIQNKYKLYQRPFVFHVNFIEKFHENSNRTSIKAIFYAIILLFFFSFSSAEDTTPSEKKSLSKEKVSFQNKNSLENNQTEKKISTENRQTKKKNKFELLPKNIFFQPGGGVRLRYDYLDTAGSAFPQNRETSEISHRAQMDLKLYKGEYVETFFRLIYFSERKMDFSEKGQGTSFTNSGFVVNQAWAFWKIDDSFGLRFGRRPIHIGLGYNYGSNEWFNVPYSFDLVDLVWDWESVSVSLIAAKVVDLGDQNPHFSGFRNNERHIIASLDVENLFKKLDIFNLSFIQINRDPDNKETKPASNGLNMQRFSLETEFKGRHFFGSVFVSHVIGEEKMANVNQLDNKGKINISQSAFDLKFGYYFSLFKNFRLWLGYHHDTGDTSPDDKSSQRFDSFYYEVYGQSGFMDFIRWGNLSFLRLGIDTNLRENWLLGMEWFNFSKTEGSDITHFGRAGGPLNKGIQKGDITLGSGKSIGNEIDLFTNLKFESGMEIRATASIFLPGQTLKGGVASTSDSLPNSVIYQCLAQVGYFF